MSSKKTWTAINISSSSEAIIQLIQNHVNQDDLMKLRIETDSIYNRIVLSMIGTLSTLISITENLVPLLVSKINLNEHEGVHYRIGAVDVIPFISLEKPFIEEEQTKLYHLGKCLSKYIPIYYYGALAKSKDRMNLSYIRQKGLDDLLNRIDHFLPDEGDIFSIKKTGACALGIRDRMIAFNIQIQTNHIKKLNTYVRSLSEKNGGIKGLMSATFKIGEDVYDASFNLILNKELSLFKLMQIMYVYINKNQLIHLNSKIIGFIKKEDLYEGFEDSVSLVKIKEYYLLDTFEKTQIIDGT